MYYEPEEIIHETRFCESCGAEMTHDEYELYESQCHDCVLEDTGGLLEDNVYMPLDVMFGDNS